MSDKIPNRFKRNNSKRTQDAMEDASEQKRSKGDNTRGARNPFSGVTILQYKSKSSAGNWHIFAKEWMKYAATKYGNLAQFMYSANNFQYYVPAQIAPPTDDEIDAVNDPHGWINKNYEDQCKLRNRELMELRQKKFPFFNDFMDHMSVESVAKLEADADFAEVRNDSDIRALWIIAAEVHQSGSNGGSKDERAVDALKAYYLNEQGKTDLDAYKKSTDAKLACIRAIDEDCVPSDARQSILFFKNLDSGRYGNIQSTAKQLSLLGDEKAYMKSLTEAYAVALNSEVINNKGKFVAAEGEYGICAAVSVNNHHGGGRGRGGRDGGGRGGRGGRGGADGRGKKADGHTKAELAAAVAVVAAASAAPAKKEMLCDLCAKPGHWCRDCPDLHKAKKAIVATATSSEGPVRPSRLLVATAIVVKVNLAGITEAITSTHVMEDTGASHGVFHNRDLLTNIRRIEQHAEIRGMGGASLFTNEVGDFEDLATVYIADGAIVNVLSHSDMHDNGMKITLSNDAFTVINPRSNPQRGLVFGRVGGLYAVNMQSNFAGVTTVAERALKYQKRDIKQAELAREVSKRLGFPSDADMAIIAGGGGSVANVPISAKDIKRAADIWGQDVNTLKGKMRQSKSKHVTFEDQLEPEDRNSDGSDSYCPNDQVQEWHGDLFFVHGDAYLIGSMLPVDMPLVTHLTDRKTHSIRKALRSQLSEIVSQEFEVSTLLFDGEGGIQALEEELNEAGYQVNTAGPKQHVPHVERKIGTLKGRIRSIHHSLPWNLPYTLLRYEVKYASIVMSMVPHHGRMDPTSPYEQFYGRKVDFKRQLRLSFGEYAEVHNNQPTASNTLEERAISCIAMLPLLNKQGTYLFFNLKTRSVLKGDKWKALPTPQWVIDRMNQLAQNQARQLPKDPEFSRNVPADDEPHMDDDDLVDAFGEPDDFQDDGNTGPNSREDWDDAHPYDDQDESVVDSTGDEESSSANDLQIDEIYNNNEDAVPTFTHRHGTRAATGTPLLVPKSLVRDYVQSDYRSFIETHPMIVTTDADDMIVTHLFHVFASQNHTVKSALAEHEDAALDAIVKELRSMLNAPTFEAVDPATLSWEQLKKRIPSKMFIKLKYLANGDFEKIKARLVAGGHRQDRTGYTDDQTSSPTAASPTLFIVAGIAARERRKVRCCDIGTAYLKAIMIILIHMLIDPTLSALLCVMRPEWTKWLDDKGRLTVVLHRALYGCIESGKLWYDTLNEFLVSIGFVANPHDICTYNKWDDDEDVQLTLSVFVDDFMITCVSDSVLDRFMNQLRERFGDLTERTGDIHSHLGMVFDFSEPGEVSITMPGYIDSMLEKYGVTKAQKYPTNNDLFVRDENSPALAEPQRKEFHSRVYTVAYMAQRIKPECLPILSELCSCVRTATAEDWCKLEHLLQYVYGCREIGMRIRIPTGQLFVNASIDSSHGCHPNMRGHGAGLISISEDGNGGTIHCESSKLSLNTKSTAETELVTMSDYASQALYIGGFLTEQGYPNVQVILEQDNESTIALVRKGRSTAKATRHIAIRYFWLHDRLVRGDFELLHVAGTEIRSDLLTKDLRGAAFFNGRLKVNNWE